MGISPSLIFLCGLQEKAKDPRHLVQVDISNQPKITLKIGELRGESTTYIPDEFIGNKYLEDIWYPGGEAKKLRKLRGWKIADAGDTISRAFIMAFPAHDEDGFIVLKPKSVRPSDPFSTSIRDIERHNRLVASGHHRYGLMSEFFVDAYLARTVYLFNLAGWIVTYSDLKFYFIHEWS